MLYSPHRRDVRVLMVEAAAAARHDDDVAAGLGAFYDERLVQMRHAVAELPDPDTAAWLVGVLVDGIGLREAAGFQLPPEPELHAALRAVLLGLGNRSRVGGRVRFTSVLPPDPPERARIGGAATSTHDGRHVLNGAAFAPGAALVARATTNDYMFGCSFTTQSRDADAWVHDLGCSRPAPADPDAALTSAEAKVHP